jgi:hypothetical protein
MYSDIFPLSDENEMTAASSREIPINYISTDDGQAIAFLLGLDAVRVRDEFRGARATGRSSRHLMRIFGDVLNHPAL